MGSYPHIFTPGRIGHVTVRNRTVMPSMGTNMSDHKNDIQLQSSNENICIISEILPESKLLIGWE